MIVDVPTPTIVIVFPATVATAVFELVYVNAPVLFEVGAVIVKGASENTLAGIEKFDCVGVALFTRKDVVVVPEL